MFRKFSVIGLFWLVFVTLSPGGNSLAFATDASDTASLIKKVVFKILPSLDEAVKNAIVEKLTSLEKHRFVYLDLSVNYAPASEGAAPYSVTYKGKPIKSTQIIGGLLMGGGVVYALGPVANYNHLVLSIFSGDRTNFPYHDIAREYSGQPGEEVFRVRGFFHVIANSIPTAIHLQLRPFTPDFEVARNVLMK